MKIINAKYLSMLLLAWCGLQANQALACGETMTFSPGAITITGGVDSINAGSALSSWSSSTTVSNVCGALPFSVLQYSKIISTQTASGITYTSDGVTYPVFPTGVTGIGYAIGVKDTTDTIYTPLSTTQAQTYPTSRTGTGGGFTLGANGRIIFVATAKLTAGTYTNASKTVGTYGGYTSASALYTSNSIVLPAVTFNVNVTSCTVNNTSIPVGLGDVNKSVFTGVGSTSPETAYNISLNCSTGTPVKLALDGTADSSNATGVLALTSAGNSGVASGLGVQLLRNNTPVTLGSIITVGTTTSAGAYSIPLTARYYQTSSTVTAGTANSTATFTMTYR
ncbi:fimbrial protein [Serratia quinivorans]|uniref:fimbrial protein n=1 Tax=Serratia quinivorans TaxID=137545 RepID=UPI001C47DD66|nr:fimbrial protein [Serratia quinivorans]MBV6694003.1 type 1 fimbrial protein [Serratia quinivorans]